MSTNTAFNLGLTLFLAGAGFFLLVWALDRQYLIGAGVICVVLALIAFAGAAIGHYGLPKNGPAENVDSVLARIEERLKEESYIAENLAVFERQREIERPQGITTQVVSPIGRKSRAANRARLAFEESQGHRHLERQEAAAIIKITSEGLRALADDWLHATPPVVMGPIKIAVIAIGTDSETKTYRNELADAFHAAGLAVDTQEWIAGPPQYQELTGKVSVIEGRPTNKVRAFVIDALRAAGIAVHQAPLPPMFLVPGYREISASVWIVVGPRE